MFSKFTTLIDEEKTSYSAHGYDWEIQMFKVKEDGSYKIFISTHDGAKGDALFIAEDTTIKNTETNTNTLIEIAKNDIDKNEDNKYGLNI